MWQFNVQHRDCTVPDTQHEEMKNNVKSTATRSREQTRKENSSLCTGRHEEEPPNNNCSENTLSTEWVIEKLNETNEWAGELTIREVTIIIRKSSLSNETRKIRVEALFLFWAHTHTHTHTRARACACVCVCVCVWETYCQMQLCVYGSCPIC